jgi:hypothetical protein
VEGVEVEVAVALMPTPCFIILARDEAGGLAVLRWRM